MKIISWNVNGIRACFAKNALFECFAKHQPDIIFFQEIKAFPHQLKEIETVFSEYDFLWNPAKKAGYAGTGIGIKKNQNLKTQKNIITQIQNWNDEEGRIAGIEVGNLILFGVYFPNGGKSAKAWEEKLQFYKIFEKQMQAYKNQGKTVIFCGDLNVAQTEQDLARPKENEGVIGFHPLERAEIAHWHAQGWHDVWRIKNPDISNQYSWWTYRAGARERNIGWRIDSFFMDVESIFQVQNIFYDAKQTGSDHCPVILELCEQ